MATVSGYCEFSCWEGFWSRSAGLEEGDDSVERGYGGRCKEEKKNASETKFE